MNTRDNDPLHVAINAKLAEVVAALSTPPTWYDDWMRLGSESTKEERLRVYPKAQGPTPERNVA
jgi:hypothetical protein